MSNTATLWGIGQVWLRYFSVFSKGIGYYLVSTFIEPILHQRVHCVSLVFLRGRYGLGRRSGGRRER